MNFIRLLIAIAAGGGGGGPVFAPSLNYSDARNSQYVGQVT